MSALHFSPTSPPARRAAVALPFVTALFCVLATFAPVHLLVGAVPAPLFGVAAVCLWTASRPAHMPAHAVFALGLIHDALSGAPWGQWALAYLLATGLVRVQAPALRGKPFGFGWLVFALAAAGAETLVWLLTAFAHSGWPDPWPFAIQLALTVALYPPIARLLALASGRVAHEAE